MNFKLYSGSFSDQLHLPTRASFQHQDSGKIYGIEVQSPDQQKLLLQFFEKGGFGSLDPYLHFEISLYHRNGDPDNKDTCCLHVMSLLLRRKHCKAKRDCSTFVLALASSNKLVQNFKHVMLKYLNSIFDKTNAHNMSFEKEQAVIEGLVTELFTILNQPKVKNLLPLGNFI